MVNDALVSLGGEFERLYTGFGRPLIVPERLIRASLIQILYSVRSVRQLMEQMQYNLLFRWFVGLGIDYYFWMPVVFDPRPPAEHRDVAQSDGRFVRQTVPRTVC